MVKWMQYSRSGQGSASDDETVRSYECVIVGTKSGRRVQMNTETFHDYDLVTHPRALRSFFRRLQQPLP